MCRSVSSAGPRAWAGRSWMAPHCGGWVVSKQAVIVLQAGVCRRGAVRVLMCPAASRAWCGDCWGLDRCVVAMCGMTAHLVVPAPPLCRVSHPPTSFDWGKAWAGCPDEWRRPGEAGSELHQAACKVCRPPAPQVTCWISAVVSLIKGGTSPAPPDRLGQTASDAGVAAAAGHIICRQAA